MKYKKRIAVFDLDGTLYIENSHIEFLCYIYNTRIFKSILARAFGSIFRRLYKHIIDALYDKKKNCANGFVLAFNSDVIRILESKIAMGYFPIIISNAPEKLIENAASKLGVAWMHAAVNGKLEALNSKYTYDKIFVCTDNETDIDLLQNADDATVIITKKTKNFFLSMLRGKSIKYMER